MTRAAFLTHLWLGVLSSAALISISVTGILLNHKQRLGLMPNVQHEPTAPLSAALHLEQLAYSALEAAPQEARRDWHPGDAVNLGLIDRMDVRPQKGYVKVRLRDKASMEVTVDIATGKVLHVGSRGDVFLEHLHSGEVLGNAFIVLSDIAAVALMLTLLTGYWLWLVPKLGRRLRGSDAGGRVTGL